MKMPQREPAVLEKNHDQLSQRAKGQKLQFFERLEANSIAAILACWENLHLQPKHGPRIIIPATASLH